MPDAASANGEASEELGEAVILSVILLVYAILCVSHYAIRCRPKSKRRYVAIAEEPTLQPEAIVVDTAAEAEDTATAEATEAERAVRAAEAAAQTAARAHRAAMAVQNLAQVRP